MERMMNKKYIITLESDNETEQTLQNVWQQAIAQHLLDVNDDVKTTTDIKISYEDVTGLI